MKFNKHKIVSIVLSLAAVSAIGFYSYQLILKTQHKKNYTQNDNYGVQTGMYDLYKTTHADIVMLGDSHIYNANWNEILNRNTIVNRGIPSDVTSGYLHRLNYIFKLNPTICFIEGGVNDVYADCSTVEIFQNFTAIIDSLQDHHIIPVVQSTLFVAPNRKNSKEKNFELEHLNQLLAEYSTVRGIEFLNINSLVTKDNFLRDDMTYDGIHLNAKGYSLWGSEVEKVLTKYGL